MLKLEMKKWDHGRENEAAPAKETRIEISTAFLLVLVLPLILLLRSGSRVPFMQNTNHTYNIGRQKGGVGHGED
ncbi:hypothetical protein ACFFIY_12270 [Bhargavaea ullalensis]|uniref:Uncharacterized protein n=1 Tax=Bhargavaea ullalensis TaxID=1265685 RepID=A0ABV2G7J8_9BACL